MDLHKLLTVSTDAGKILLESGAEIYRVEDTIVRICNAFGVDSAESFVTPTGIMVSVTSDNETATLVRRIKQRGVDLNRIDLINNLSRMTQSHLLTIEQLEKKLNAISVSPRYSYKVTFISTCFAAGCFALMFGGNFKDFICTFIVGGMLKLLLWLFAWLDVNSFFTNCLGGAFSSIAAFIITSLVSDSHYDKTIIGSIMLLVPGLIITNAIRDIIAGDYLSGVTKASEAFLIALAIAVGTGAVLSIILRF